MRKTIRKLALDELERKQKETEARMLEDKEYVTKADIKWFCKALKETTELIQILEQTK